MIQKSAAALTRLWEKSGVIIAADRDAYQYGLELLFSTVLNIAIMICISFSAGHAWLLIPYLAIFVPLRLSAGGYHAKHHLSCIMLNGLVYLFLLISAIRLAPAVSASACIVESCLSLTLFFLFSPVPARNKPLSQTERKRNRRISLCLSLLLLMLCIIFFHMHLLEQLWCKMLFCGQAAATVLLVMEKAAFSRSIHDAKKIEGVDKH